MKRALIATAYALSALPAMAADMPAKAPPPAPVPIAYNWTGLYTATTLGLGWQEVNGVFVTPPPDVHHTDSTRAWYGTYIGAQYMWNSWVVGIEGSYSVPISRSFDSQPVGPDCFNITLTPSTACNARITDVWTVGGKLGYAFGNWLVYGAGGYANGRIEQIVVDTATNVSLGGARVRHDGFYAGAGFDYYIGRIWFSDLILGMEYRHIDLGTATHFDSSGLAANNKQFDATIDMVSAKLSFKWTP
jgi:outer membrane immunogenic protein